MSLLIRIERSSVLTPEEKIILRLLGNEYPQTADQIIGTLLSDPFDLTFEEVLNGLNGLREKGLLKIERFSPGEKAFTIDTYLTFSVEWALKI